MSAKVKNKRDTQKEIEKYISEVDNHNSNINVSSYNLKLDIPIWFFGIIVSIIPTVLSQIFFPSSFFQNMTISERIFTATGFVYSFLNSLLVLTIEVLLTKSANDKIEKHRIGIFVIFLAIEIFLIALYITLGTQSYETIQKIFEGNLLKLNIAVIITSFVISLLIFIIHSLPNPKK